MRTIAIIQARLTSSRLPNKVLMPMAGRPMLSHVLQRAATIRSVDGICLTIPDTGPNMALAEAAKGHYITTGPEHDVLERYRIAAEVTNADRIIRITADCPLLDPAIADAVIALHDQDPTVPYASNVYPKRTWPDGLDVEVFTVMALETACMTTVGRKVGTPNWAPREHPTLAMRGAHYPCLESFQDLGRLKWSVDTQGEFDFVEQVIANVSGYRMADTIQAIKDLGMWDGQPESDDWKRQYV